MAVRLREAGMASQDRGGGSRNGQPGRGGGSDHKTQGSVHGRKDTLPRPEGHPGGQVGTWRRGTSTMRVPSPDFPLQARLRAANAVLELDPLTALGMIRVQVIRGQTAALNRGKQGGSNYPNEWQGQSCVCGPGPRRSRERDAQQNRVPRRKRDEQPTRASLHPHNQEMKKSRVDEQNWVGGAHLWSPLLRRLR